MTNGTDKFYRKSKLTKILITLMVMAPLVSHAINLPQGSANSGANNSQAHTAANQQVFSPYKDVGINLNWYDPNFDNMYVIGTTINESSATPLVNALPTDVQTVTWGFATGECGNEGWVGVPTAGDFESHNVNSFVNAHKNYIVSTGGQAGIFTCSTNAGMQAFVSHYMSPNLIGFDFDIEGSQTPDQITSLVNNIVYAKKLYPDLRISFTLATSADSTGMHAGLNSLGDLVVRTAESAGLDFYVNLMTMDYGDTASPSICVINPSTGQCDMGLSGIQAVENLQYTYNIPNNRIEVTPLIGNADVLHEVFTINDAQVLAAYVKNNNLAGFHFWSYDRDTPCIGTNQNNNYCNSAPGVSTLEFTNTIAAYFQ